MSSQGKRYKILKADIDFDTRIENIIMERKKRGLDKKMTSRREVTKMIAKSNSFNQVEKELLSEQINLRSLLR